MIFPSSITMDLVNATDGLFGLRGRKGKKPLAVYFPAWRSGDRYEAQWRGMLLRYATRRLGHKRVHEITTADVMGVLLADDFWNRKRVTARVVRQRIGAVMKWAVAQGFREDTRLATPSTRRCRRTAFASSTNLHALPALTAACPRWPEFKG